MKQLDLLPTAPRSAAGKTFSPEELAACRRYVELEMARSIESFDRDPLWFATSLYRAYLGPFETARPLPTPAALERETKRLEREEKERRYGHLGIPRGPCGCYWRAMYSDFDDLPAVPSGNILITGANGSGKTHLAAAIAKIRGARWIAADVAASIEPSKFSRTWKESTHAVLDDLLRGKQTNTGIASLVSLVALRVENDLKTIVTCDRTAHAIFKFDSALGSRLAGFLEVQLEGRDRRQGGDD